jgi:hypothetical protein
LTTGRQLLQASKAPELSEVEEPPAPPDEEAALEAAAASCAKIAVDHGLGGQLPGCLRIRTCEVTCQGGNLVQQRPETACTQQSTACRPQLVVLELEGLGMSFPLSSTTVGMPFRERSILRLLPATSTCCAAAAPAGQRDAESLTVLPWCTIRHMHQPRTDSMTCSCASRASQQRAGLHLLAAAGDLKQASVHIQVPNTHRSSAGLARGLRAGIAPHNSASSSTVVATADDVMILG